MGWVCRAASFISLIRRPEPTVQDAVAHAREHGYSRTFIGFLSGITGETARQRYDRKQHA